MPRLIDAENLWKAITSRIEENCDLADLSEIIETQPTVDAVPVIRCKDCVFWKNYCRIVDGVRSDHVCSKKRELDGTMHRTKADDFCSWAERREE